MNKIIAATFLLIGLVSCQESLENKSVREAKEYTEKFCPTPVTNNTRTDSVAFIKETKTYTYYCSFVGRLDDKQIVDQNKGKLNNLLVQEIKSSTNIKQLKDAGFNFEYIVRSEKSPKEVLYQLTISKKDYQ
ncbi:MAG: hypothetical protein WAR39_02230 [Prevotella sp.]